jgi:hypothetical protein
MSCWLIGKTQERSIESTVHCFIVVPARIATVSVAMQVYMLMTAARPVVALVATGARNWISMRSLNAN